MNMDKSSSLFVSGDPISVLGLGISGGAAARLAHAHGAEVYASDASEGPVQRDVVERLKAEGIDAEAGHHDVNRILASRLVITSPGIAPSTDIRRAIKGAAVPIVAEIELAFRHLKSHVIGITGTNGKTTTTALCGHLLQRAGINSITAGNIGRPLSDVAMFENQPDWVVVELSSFQLADVEKFRPTIGVLLNLATDHLDRYPNIECYHADKARLFANADENSQWVLNGSDAEVLAMAGTVPGRKYLASIAAHEELGAFVNDSGHLVQWLESDTVPKPWVNVDELQLVGEHNVMNGLLAGLAAALAGCGSEAVGIGLASFDGLPHRLQRVGEYDRVLWINDSKGTNVSAAKCAIAAFQRPVVSVLGGRHKGESYASLVPVLRERARSVITFGEAAPQIVRELGGVISIEIAHEMEQVVELAREVAQAGDVVLFSPACSSFDMFSNYQERGFTFERCVKSAHGESSEYEA
jgi:UDP-N-acetylmuramoylalanine--D-glutamate ligase